MNRGHLFVATIVALSIAPHVRADAIPAEFRDAETGARIVHVSRVPNERSGVIYFHQGTATADSRRVLFHVQYPEKWRYLYTFDLQTQQVTPIVTDRLTANQEFSPRSNNVYYLADHAAWATNIDTRQTRKLADLPKDWSVGQGLSVNADETLLAGATELGAEPMQAPSTAPATGPTTAPESARLKSIGSTFNLKRENLLYTIDLKTGELKVIHRINTWLGHLQFSPTDPSLLMYCHEGPWGRVDRIWTIRIADGAAPTIGYQKKEGEIAGHEFWAPDGKTIWFQNHVRSRKESFVAGKAIDSETVTRYRIPPEGTAVHHVLSPDGKWFLGDGKGPDAASKYLTVQEPDGDTLKVTKICSLQGNDYAQSEPNPHLTPDQRWAVFTASFHGTPQAYAVELPERFWRK